MLAISKFCKIQIMIQSLLTLISTSADFTTLVLNLKKFSIKFTSKTLKAIQNDKKTVADILNECFNRKEVLWQQPGWENGYWCYNSLVELQEKCDQYCTRFLTTSDDKQYFFYQLLRLWGNYSNEAYKDLFRNKDNHEYDLAKILRKLRLKTYPIIISFMQQLPDTDLIKQECMNRLEYGCKNSKLSIKQILPIWQ
jgi:hypothetical protein